jgi:DNA-binding response OmpR family regulator
VAALRDRCPGVPIAALGPPPDLEVDLALPRPVRLASMIAALEALVLRAAAGRIGPWRFDPLARVIENGAGRRIRLTDKEAAILAYLRADGGVVARDRLLAQIWGYSAAVTTHTLETHIYRLRRKIESDPANATLLLSEDGGYRLAR